MSRRKPVLSGQDVAKALKRLGFSFVSQRGSHMKYRRESSVVMIPDHPEIARGTLASILRQADATDHVPRHQARDAIGR